MKLFLYTAAFLLILFRSFSQDSVMHKMDDYFGVNVHIDQSYQVTDFPLVVDWVRDYSDWPNFESENNLYTFTNGFLNFDSAYQALKQTGVKNLIVIEDIPKWISPAPDHKHAGGFSPKGAKDGLQPEDYTEAAEFFYQFAARYGSEKVQKKELLTADKLSGLDLMDALEVMNEADGDTSWGNFVTIKEYAALLNAVYDGNKGALGPGMGIKAADPNLPVSITGLGNNLQSLKKIVNACGRAPFDIVNLHFYAFRHVREDYRVAVPPEWSSLEKDVSATARWVEENIPGKEIWLTEMGWGSIPENNSEAVTVQESADYLIRSFMIALGAGAEKCFWYYWKDYKAGVFSTMGLFEDTGDSRYGNSATKAAWETQFRPKLQYWYLATMRTLLHDTYFVLNNSKQIEPTIYDYHFLSTDGNRLIRVMWHCPLYQYDWLPLNPPKLTRKVSVNLPEGYSNLRVLKPAAHTAQGETIAPKRIQDQYQVVLGSTPLFLIFEK